MCYYIVVVVAHILLLDHHPVVQMKVKAEIKEIIGAKKSTTSEDIKALKFLEMVIKEVVRVYAVIPYLPRLVVCDVRPCVVCRVKCIFNSIQCIHLFCITNLDVDLKKRFMRFAHKLF